MRLRQNEMCPIHRSVSCCGREIIAKPKLIRLGVQRIEDAHHPRGYRELRSLAEMRKMLKRKIAEQDGICTICEEEFTDYGDVVPTIKNRRESAVLGGTITRTISRRYIGGAIRRKGQREADSTDGR